MAKQVNIHAAKTHFSKLVEEVEAGGDVTIARAGKPVLKLVKIDQEPRAKRDFAKLAGLIEVPDWEALERSDADLSAAFNDAKFDYLGEE
jgi:prevent-host-death family protein